MWAAARRRNRGRWSAGGGRGEHAVPFIDDGHLNVRVWCKDDAGNDGAAVRCAVAVTIEAGTALRVYERGT
jgi:hypothetical protein